MVLFNFCHCIFNMFWGDDDLKKLRIFLLFLIFFNISTLTSFAQGIYSVDTSIKVYDYADLFSDEEEVSLSNQANEILERQKIDIVIVTTDDFGGKSSQEYADDFYDYNYFGYGNRKSGLLIVINMQERDVAISTTGEAIDLVNNSSINKIMDEVIDNYLMYGDYYGAGVSFLNSADERISSQRAAQLPFNERYSKGQIALFSTGIALVVSSVIIGVMYFMHRLSLSPSPNASVYSGGGIRLFRRNDQFISTHTSRTPIPKDTGSGGGGTSVHTSSSGTSHGGGSRKF